MVPEVGQQYPQESWIIGHKFVSLFGVIQKTCLFLYGQDVLHEEKLILKQLFNV